MVLYKKRTLIFLLFFLSSNHDVIICMTSNYVYDIIDIMPFCNCDVIVVAHWHVYTTCDHTVFIGWQYYMENGLCYKMKLHVHFGNLDCLNQMLSLWRGSKWRVDEKYSYMYFRHYIIRHENWYSAQYGLQKLLM